MKKLMLFLSVSVVTLSIAQTSTKDDSWKKNYRAFSSKVNDLVHTKLDAKFDYTKCQLIGKVWITLKPHFYATDSLQLDAKGMDIRKVEMVNGSNKIPLKYKYDSTFLNITLDKVYKNNESYTVYIDYSAKPNDLKTEGSAAITDAKGLYFINPLGEEKNKPTQIWTQGETEATSVWVPTIDKPNQKSTNEFFMTVPAKYVTLSNGKLISQTKNADGTRTDYWKMDLPHAPYLFFMGVGDYAIVKDSYKGKEVNYYVEKAYEKVAKKIFGNTPEMMKFFAEKVTGIEYPWNKYAQITARDYVSGAMENTTATLHQESAQQDARELVDDNGWEGTIAHELFHQWFGDYVTAESWSNLTVNESFANYSQTLWKEYKYGKDAGDEENYNDMQGYLMSGSQSKDLARFYYRDKEDMFDAVSYNKGGRILHMLRNYIGDDAFFKSLNKYLTTNKFGTGSAHKLRLAFEEITGKDLNWFFNQWYFGSGHPMLDISYNYNADNNTVSVYMKQTQSTDKVFKLPFAIDVYETNNSKKRYAVWMNNKTDTFTFLVNAKPNLVNVDADKILLCTKKESKKLPEYIYQYSFAGNYLDRKEALDFAAKKSNDSSAIALFKKALNDTFATFRMKAIQTLSNTDMDKETITKIEKLANNDPSRLVRAEAIDALSTLKDEQYKQLFIKGTADSSYSVAGNCLEALVELDSTKAIELATTLSKQPSKGKLASAISNILVKYGDESAYDYIADNFDKMPLSQAKFQSLNSFVAILKKVKDPTKFKSGIDKITTFRDAIPESAKAQTTPFINNTYLKSIADKKEKDGETDLASYVKSKL